jgi:uncharacterized protein YkwD
LGLVACVTAVLLLGIVIGRLTMTPTGADDVYLRNSEPKELAKASPTPAPPKQRYRPALAPVARAVADETAPATGQAASPTAQARPRDGHMIDGSYGDGDQTTTHGGDELAPSSGHLSMLEADVVGLVNAERAKKKGCRPLRIDQRLVQSARTHSAEMAASNALVHESPDGTTPWQRMARYQHGGAENIARGYQSAEEAVRGWMASPTHRANILNCRLTTTGVGVSLGPGGPWWTQDFGYP